MLVGTAPPPPVVVLEPVMTGVVGVEKPGGTETWPPPGHHDGNGWHVDPGLPTVTLAGGEGATTAGPMSDSSLPLNEDIAKA